MNWDKDSFINYIIAHNIVGFFKEPLKLSSGRMSYWYVNWRNVAEDVFSIDILSEFVIAFVQNLELEPDCFYGVPEGATKLGIITQYKWAKTHSNFNQGSHILSMGRAKPKEHGDPKDRFFLGVPNGKVIILEDVTTTGGSLLSTIESLNKINTDIIAAIGITNRNELRDDKKSVEDAVKELGIQYFAMSNAIELLPKVFSIQEPGEEIGKHIENYFKQYGIEELKLL
jgi:orotate phosphoribosyltransferase